MDNLRNMAGLKPKKSKKRKEKFSIRKKYLKGFFSFVSVLATVLVIAVIKNSTNNNIDTSDLDNNRNVIGNAVMTPVDIKWDPSQELLISQYFIGNPKDVDAVDDDSKLANLTYKTYAAVPETSKADPKSKTIRVNDHYIVVVSTGVSEGFDVINYQFKPEALNKSLGTNDAQVTSFLVKESQLKRYRKLRVEPKEGYIVSYDEFLISNYKKSLAKAKEKVVKAEKRIAGNEDLITKLKDKMVDATDSDATDLQSQIDDAKDSIDQDKALIETQKKEQKHYQDRINSVQSEMSF